MQLTWQVSPRNKVAFQFRADPDEATNANISSRVTPESSLGFNRDVETYTVNWTAPYSPKVLVESTFAWQDISNGTFPSQPGLRNTCVPNANQKFLNEAYCTDITANTVSGSWWRTVLDNRQRFTVKGQATVYGGRFWGMTHQFRMGVNVENERYFRNLEQRPRITFQVIALGDDDSTIPEGETPDIEQFGQVTSRISVPQQDEVRATGTNWAIYGEDQFKPAQNLTITLGVRVDREELNSGGRAPFNAPAELRGLHRVRGRNGTHRPVASVLHRIRGHPGLHGTAGRHRLRGRRELRELRHRCFVQHRGPAGKQSAECAQGREHQHREHQRLALHLAGLVALGQRQDGLQGLGRALLQQPAAVDSVAGARAGPGDHPVPRQPARRGELSDAAAGYALRPRWSAARSSWRERSRPGSRC